MSVAQSPLEQPFGHIVWERWLREGIQKLDQAKLLRSLRPIEAIASNDSSPEIFLNELRESRQISVQTTRDDTQDEGDVEGLESNIELERNTIARGAAKRYDGRGKWDSIGTTATVSAATLSSWIQERISAGDLKHTFTPLAFNLPLNLSSKPEALLLSSPVCALRTRSLGIFTPSTPLLQYE